MRLDEEVFEFDREDDEIESEYDTENVDAELSEQAQRQLLKEQQLIDELEADAAIADLFPLLGSHPRVRIRGVGEIDGSRVFDYLHSRQR